MVFGPNGIEHRRYFRVDTEASIGYEILSEQESVAHREGLSTGVEHIYNSSFDARINTLLTHLKSHDPMVAEALSLLNRKMNAIANEIEGFNDANDAVVCSIQRVNLSACGVSFVTDQFVKIGDLIRFHIFIGENRVILLAKLVASDEISEHRYRWRLNFEGVGLADEEALIQYVMKCDARNRRAALRSDS